MKRARGIPLIWIGWGVAFIAYEVYALRKHRDGHGPLTNVVVRHVPAEVTYLFIAWLAIHFSIRYSKKARKRAHRALAH